MEREWQVGDRLENRWEIHKVMRGGMGVVYVVFDREWQEVLAAKTFQDAVFARNPRIQELFTREALAWVQLDAHPNIAQALFVQEIEGKPVLFLEFVSGGDLSQWIGTPGLTQNLPRLLRFSLEFCDGIIHARSKGIQVHRDIKPQNCLICADDTLKLTDFGLAKVLDDDPGDAESSSAAPLSLSRTGNAAGTPTHMAPEQFVDAKHVGVAADVYSFGVMLFQMATGGLPFQATTWDGFREQHTRVLPPVALIADASLRGIVARCLEKEPALRWPDFESLRQALVPLYETAAGLPAPSLPAETEVDALRWLNKGVSLAALGVTDRAIACYDVALRLNPNFAEALMNRATLVRDQGRHAEALAGYDAALAVNPRLEMAWYNKGVTLEMDGRFLAALQCLDQAIEINPDMALAWSSRGVVLDRLSRGAEAFECFERALHLNPRLAAAWMNKGNLLRNEGKLEEALAAHDHALELRPNLGVAWFNKANVLVDLQRPDAALGAYDKAVELMPENVSIWQNKAALLERLGRHDDALSVLAGCSRSNPASVVAWHNRALKAKELGRLDEALLCHDRALEVDPYLEEGWLGKANLLVALKRGEDAIAAYDELLSINPESKTGWFSKGATLANLSRYDEAIECFEMAQQYGHSRAEEALKACRNLAKSDAGSWHDKGAELSASGQHKEAVECFDRALAQHPKSAITWFGKAVSLTQLSRFDDALAAFDRALEIDPNLGVAWYSRGITLGPVLGRIPEALDCFRKALACGFAKAAEDIAQCEAELAKRPAETAATWNLRGLELDKEGKYDEALACFEKAIGISPGDPNGWYYKGRALGGRATRYQPALECFERAVQLGHPHAAQGVEICRKALAAETPPPTDAASWQRRGTELFHLGNRHAEALQCFDNALAQDPRMLDSHWGRGVVLGQLGRHQEAVVALEAALVIDPRRAGVWMSKGNAFLQLRRFAEAMACYQQAKGLGDPEAGQGIAYCRRMLGWPPA